MKYRTYQDIELEVRKADSFSEFLKIYTSWMLNDFPIYWLKKDKSISTKSTIIRLIGMISTLSLIYILIL